MEGKICLNMELVAPLKYILDTPYLPKYYFFPEHGISNSPNSLDMYFRCFLFFHWVRCLYTTNIYEHIIVESFIVLTFKSDYPLMFSIPENTK